MASDDPLESMRLYEEAMWPAIEHAENHYRRIDRLCVCAYLLGLVMICLGTGLLTMDPWTGFFVGLSIAFSFQAGVLFKSALLRREAFRQMRVLHEQAEFTLSYHGGDEP